MKKKTQINSEIERETVMDFKVNSVYYRYYRNLTAFLIKPTVIAGAAIAVVHGPCVRAGDEYVSKELHHTASNGLVRTGRCAP